MYTFFATRAQCIYFQVMSEQGTGEEVVVAEQQPEVVEAASDQPAAKEGESAPQEVAPGEEVVLAETEAKEETQEEGEKKKAVYTYRQWNF